MPINKSRMTNHFRERNCCQFSTRAVRFEHIWNSLHALPSIYIFLNVSEFNTKKKKKKIFQFPTNIEISGIKSMNCKEKYVFHSWCSHSDQNVCVHMDNG